MGHAKIIFMGRTGCGKTTLCQKLHEMDLSYKKTQSIENYQSAIDTPGEYLENRSFYRALITTAADAKLIAMLADPTVSDNYIPPAFAATFAKEMIGIITKVSLVTNQEQLNRTERELRQSGAQKIFFVDTLTDVGIKELFDYIHQRLDS